MLRIRKIAAATTGLALLMAAGMTSAIASNNNGNDKVTVCHATGSTTNPIVRIHIPRHTAEEKGHFTHGGDTIVEDPDNVEQCETPPPPGGGDNNRGCNATSEAGDTTQIGLINADVDAANLAANTLCQPEILNYLTLAVLGHSTGGSALDSGLLGGGTGGVLTGCSTLTPACWPRSPCSSDPTRFPVQPGSLLLKRSAPASPAGGSASARLRSARPCPARRRRAGSCL